MMKAIEPRKHSRGKPRDSSPRKLRPLAKVLTGQRWDSKLKSHPGVPLEVAKYEEDDQISSPDRPSPWILTIDATTD